MPERKRTSSGTPLANQRVIVIGAGMAGVAAGVRLQAAGASVTVLEASDHIGGRIRTVRRDGHVIDVGAQLIGSNDRAVYEVLRLSGASFQLHRPVADDAIVGSRQSFPLRYGSPGALITTGALSLRAKFKLGAHLIPMVLGAPDRLTEAAQHDQRTIAELVSQIAGKDTFATFADPLLSAFYRLDGEATSAAYILTSARASAKAHPLAAASGLSVLLEAAARRLDVRLGCEVSRVRLQPPGVNVETSDETFHASGCVVAVPGNAVPQLLDDLPTGVSEWFGGVGYARAASLALVLTAPPKAEYFAYAYVGRDRLIGSAAVLSNKHRGLVAPGQSVMLFFPRPERADEFADLHDETLVHRVVQECDPQFPRFGEGIESVIRTAWQAGVPRMNVGIVARLRAFETLPLPPALAFAGDYLRGPTIDGAAASGLAAADRLISTLS